MTCFNIDINIKAIKSFYKKESNKFVEYDYKDGVATPTGVTKRYEPTGKYIFCGYDRNDQPHFKVKGTGYTTFVGSVFTFGFIANPKEGGLVTYQEITESDFYSTIEALKHAEKYGETDMYVNFMGHLEPAEKAGVEMARISIEAYPGDTITWLQLEYHRLEEGATTSPVQNYSYMSATIYGPEMKEIIDTIIKNKDVL
jgi:hypothetical protein